MAAAAFLIGCAACGGSTRPELNVSAAISLSAPLQDLAPRMEEAARARIAFNFGASNDLARQILAARRADLFLSADEEQMDVVERAGLVEAGTRAPFLSNRLVIVVPSLSPLRDLPDWIRFVRSGEGRLSIADPQSVPAGRYAKRWLQSGGQWEEVADRVIPALDARAALAAVESGAAEAGIVYRTDAALSRRIRVIDEGEAPAGWDDQPKIVYVAAAIADRPRPEKARAALAFLRGSEARAVFESYGFIVPGS